jgi:FkbM family methyltransferase
MKIAGRLRTFKLARCLRFQLSILKRLFKPSLGKLNDEITREGIDLVIDAGANVGQFATDLRSAGYQGLIISFEPASAPFSTLHKRAKRDPLWQVFNLGLGNLNGEAILHIASNSGLSSSILPPYMHSEFFPEIKFNEEEKIQISTLSSFIKSQELQSKRILLKIDAQGYEGLIIDGALEIFDSVFYTYLELSMVQLYKGESTALEILNKLSELGHEISDVNRGIESKLGKLLQIDVLTRKIDYK